MYTCTFWKDQVDEHPDRYRLVENPDGTVQLQEAFGEEIQQGTPQSATHFNQIEMGITDSHLASAIFLQYFLQFERETKKNDQNYAAEFLNEVQTITLDNTQRWPFNNSQKTIALQKVRKTMNYDVVCEVTSAQGNVGDIVVTDKQLNGFKLAFDGSATRVTMKVRIKGGMLV